MREFVQGSDAQFAAMKKKLDEHPGQVCRYEGLEISESFSPSRCSLDLMRDEAGVYHFRFFPALTCPEQTDGDIRAILRDGFSGSFEELTWALRVTLAPLVPLGYDVPYRHGEWGPNPPEDPPVSRRPDPPVGEQPLPKIRNLPESLPEEETLPPLDPDRLCRELESRVIGHTGQLEPLCRLVANHVGKVHPQRPLCLFLAGGPGTGKTYTAECLQQALSGQGQPYGLIRVNLNEFKDSISANRMVGAAAGYVGYGDGLIFDPLLSQERQVILLDEAEKAHRDVQDMLLQIMDKGQLQLAAPRQGKSRVDFCRAILIFTSNLPVDESRLQGKDADEELRRMLAQGFRPEFVSRLQYCAFFSPLSRRQQLLVAAGCLGAVAQEYGLTLEQTDYRALEKMLSGQSRFGARVFKSRAETLFGRLFAQGYREGLRRASLVWEEEDFRLKQPGEPQPPAEQAS